MHQQIRGRLLRTTESERQREQLAALAIQHRIGTGDGSGRGPGATAGQLADVLHFTELGEHLRDELRELRAFHDRFDSSEKIDLRVADGLWGHDAYKFLESFQEDVHDVFGGVIRDVDFRNHAESARREINDWVSNVTREKIQDLLKPGAVNDMTRLILVNALYFRAKWSHPFDPQATTDKPY